MFAWKSVKSGRGFMVGCLMMLTMAIGIFLTPIPGQAILEPPTVTEQIFDYGYYKDFAFTINTGGYQVVAFAVGNDEAESAWLGGNYNGPDGWSPAVINNDEDGWQGIGITIDLSWVTLTDYTHAFLFYDDDLSTALGSGITYGFMGSSLVLMSDFVARDSSGNTHEGLTTVVPIPGAVWLLGSGLLSLGLLGRRRKES